MHEPRTFTTSRRSASISATRPWLSPRSGSSVAAGMLASSVEVARVSLKRPGGLNPHGGGGHRRTQRTGDAVYVQIVTHAPTPAEVERAVDSVADRRGGTVQMAGAKMAY